MTRGQRFDVTIPQDLAAALLSRPVTPLRIRRLVRLTKGRSDRFVEQTLAALPAEVREQVRAAIESR